jgi:O-antigen/teichoic acid export membrane protein
MTTMTTSRRRSPSGLWRRFRGATLVAAGMAVMNIGGYAFTLIAVHRVAPADFGALTALIGLILIGNVAALGLQATGARRIATLTATDPSGHDVLAASLLRAGAYTAAALSALSLLLTPLMMWLLHIDSVISVLLVAPSLGLLTLMGAQAGVLQGGKHWRELALLYASFGIGRLVFAFVGLAISPDLLGAMIGFALSTAVPVLLAGWMLRGGGHGSSAEVRRVLSETVHGTHVLLAFFAVANADVLLARTMLDEHDSGIYAAGVIVAKACLFVPQFVSVVVFPSLATNPGDTRRLRQAVIAVAGFGVCAVAGAALLPDLVVAVVGGSEYAEIGPIAWMFAAAGSAYAVLQLVVYAAIAQQERRAAIVIWVGLALFVAVAVLVVGRDVVTGIAGVKFLVACAATTSILLSTVLATGLHRQVTTEDRTPTPA